MTDEQTIRDSWLGFGPRADPDASAALDRIVARLAEAEKALEWALGRVAMPGCRCSTGNDGPCTCDKESWPEWKALRRAEALLHPDGAA